MTTETETNRGRFFVLSLLPWVAAGGMLLLYLLTRNHWPSAGSILHISELRDWYTPHHFFNPVYYLVAYPLRWLPPSLMATGLNIFGVVCSVLTLALLARSVALMPHDRTHEQRQRQLGDSAILSIPAAWLPPIFAVLVCGLEMTFWENSTNTAGYNTSVGVFEPDGAGQMFDLLLFAYCIRCLLEFRINFKESWLARFAFVYGLGVADNWLMLGLFPLFLAALIWIRGVGFFSSRSLAILSIAGLAGLSLILFFPIRVAMEHLPGFGFWDALRYILRTDKAFITALPRETLLLLSLTSLLPIFIIGIRWASYFGDTSQLGILLATFIFHIVHLVLFVTCIWVTFDPPFSPREQGYTLPLLPLYYLSALSIGYFAGYFLLIFGTRSPKLRYRPHPLVQFLNFAVVTFICALALLVPLFQVWKNLPQLHDEQAADGALDRLSALTAQGLPKQPAVVLSDDRVRLLLLQRSFAEDSGATKHLFIETSLLDQDPAYIFDLQKKFPGFNYPQDLRKTGRAPGLFELLHFFLVLGEKHDIYYIHPSFGVYFERFYMEPRGLVYQLKSYDTNSWQKPSLTSAQITENQKIWNNLAATELPIITNLLGRPRQPVSPLLQYAMNEGHLTIESNRTASVLGSWYARSLDYWGVELQRSGLLPEAEKAFADTLQFNPGSLSGRVNLQFNQTLRAGKPVVVEPPPAVRDKFGVFRSWTSLLGTDGPFDDPGFCYVLGETFAAGENYHEGAPVQGGPANYLQAVQQFERVHVLAPDYVNASFWLCKLFLSFHKQSEALAIAEQVLQRDPNNLDALFYQASANMQSGSYDQAIPPLNHLLTLQTNSYQAQLYRAISYLQISNYPSAKADYSALAQLDPKVVPIRPYWVDYGLQEVAYHEKDTNDVIKYCELYLTNYYQYFSTNFPESAELKSIKQRLKEFQNGAP